MNNKNKWAAVTLLVLGVIPLHAGDAPEAPITLVEADRDMDDLCAMLTELVRADPERADDILRRALESRDSWTDEQITALYQAVMEGVPDSLTYMQQHLELLQAAFEQGDDDFSELGDPIAQGVLTVLSETTVLGDSQRDSLSGGVKEQLTQLAVTGIQDHAAGRSPVTGDVLQDVSAAKEKPQIELDVLPQPVPPAVTPAQ